MGNIGSHVHVTSGAIRHQAFPAWIRRAGGRGLFGIAAGVGLAHRNHIIHRDLKPGNVVALKGGCIMPRLAVE
jgi:hypothetical protein